MISSAVTISLVEQARGGPFVFWDNLDAACQTASKLGFDAVEIFAPGPSAFDHDHLRTLLDDLGLKLAALGTGAGWVIHGKQLCAADAADRQDAKEFIRSVIDAASKFGAVAIIGSMQGRHDATVDQPTAMAYLAEALNELGEHARQFDVPLIYEPLNRYETNLITTMATGVEFFNTLDCDNVKLLADLFHMNIEEASIANAIRTGGSHIGHIHFVDSNRRAAGMGHMDYGPIAEAIREIGYSGYLSAEAFALPTSEEAARQTIESFRRYFAG
jgi:sugar phosphate isomerase/epimerase